MTNAEEVQILKDLIRNLNDFEWFMWDVLPQLSDNHKEVYAAYGGRIDHLEDDDDY